MIDLRLGGWEDALIDVEQVDALITDPPYSERTHAGHDAIKGVGKRRGLDYEAWRREDVDRFVESWHPRVRGWIVIMTDWSLAPHFEAALQRCDRYVFAPLPFVSPGSRVRLLGDGPSCWTAFVIVARPRSQEFSTWGTLPGAYVVKPERRMLVTGGKPIEGMRAIVRDYSRAGDLVADPFAGGATTLIAAAVEGRRSVGCEIDEDTFSKARKRIDARIALGWDPGVPPVPAALHGRQGKLTL